MLSLGHLGTFQNFYDGKEIFSTSTVKSLLATILQLFLFTLVLFFQDFT